MRHRLATVATAVMLLLPGATAGAEPELPDSTELVQAFRFRAEHALATDARSLLRAVADPDANMDFGVPLTSDEADEIVRRNEGLEQAADLIRLVRANSRRYAGIWLDHSSGGVIEILLAGDDPAARSEALGVAPTTVDVRFRIVTRSYSELEALRDRLLAAWDELVAAGVDVQLIRIEELSNTVAVGVPTPSDVLTETVRSIAKDDSVILVEAEVGDVACNARTSCTPWRGGLYTNSATMACTTNFNARPTAASSTRYMITAAHCTGDASSSTFRHDGVLIGTSNRRSFNLATAHSDSLRVPMSSAGSGTPYNVIYVDNASKARPITADKPEIYHAYGQTICGAGITSGYRCGQITYRGVGITTAGRTMYFTEVTFLSGVGDSGGPAFYQSTAYGLVAKRTSTRSYISGIDLVMLDMQTRLCLNSSCS